MIKFLKLMIQALLFVLLTNLNAMESPDDMGDFQSQLNNIIPSPEAQKIFRTYFAQASEICAKSTKGELDASSLDALTHLTAQTAKAILGAGINIEVLNKFMSDPRWGKCFFKVSEIKEIFMIECRKQAPSLRCRFSEGLCFFIFVSVFLVVIIYMYVYPNPSYPSFVPRPEDYRSDGSLKDYCYGGRCYPTLCDYPCYLGGPRDCPHQ